MKKQSKTIKKELLGDLQKEVKNHFGVGLTVIALLGLAAIVKYFTVPVISVSLEEGTSNSIVPVSDGTSDSPGAASHEQSQMELPLNPLKTNKKNDLKNNGDHSVEIMSPVAFQALTEETLQAIPTTSDLQKLSDEELHHLPRPLLIAGSYLGQVAQAVEDNPALRSHAVGFYSKCLHKSEYPVSVRALCYKELKEISVSENIELSYAEDNHVPVDVRVLSQKL